MKIVSFYVSLATLLLVFPPYIISQEGLNQRVAKLSEQIAKEMTVYKKTTIAVVEFSDLYGNVTAFGKFLAEELITHLFQTKKFKVIERQLLNKVIAEQKLSLKGLVDPSSAKQLGKLLGVDAIVSGTITDLSQSLRVNARLISTETAEIFAVASTEIFKDESVMMLMAKGTTTPDKKATTSSTATKKGVIQKVEAKNFTFELIEVKTSGASLTFEFLITNNGQDRKLSLYYTKNSRIIDDSGNEYQASKIQLGNRTSGYTPVTNLLISGIPTKAKLSFEKVSSQAKRIALFEIDCYSFKVQLRNIPLIK